MSLLLVAGYDSGHEDRILRDARDKGEDGEESSSDGDEEGADAGDGWHPGVREQSDQQRSHENESSGAGGAAQQRSQAHQRRKQQPTIETRGKTGLPSAAFAFTEVSCVPDFLRPAALAAEPASALSKSAASVAGITGAHSHVQHRGSAAPVSGGPAGRTHTVEEAHTQAQRGGRRGEDEARLEKVAQSAGAGRRLKGAAMPPKDDAVALTRLCDSCQVPKTFSHARGGMVCPLCGDRPKSGQDSTKGEGKKREGAVKDKERQKRMKGQSSHATWKSETEMQLRQTYD